MNQRDIIVEVDHVDKVFYNRFFLKRDEDTGRRPFTHRKPVHAVDDVAFAIPRGSIFGLLGPNGAGKTTTVKMVSGLVRPSGGRVLVDGYHVENQRHKVLSRIGVVLEGTRTVIWPLTPMENLAYFGNLKGVTGRKLRERANDLLEFIGLGEKKHVQVRRLSRGQKQKLAICIALIADPPVLLLDEPTTGLDVQSSRTIKDRIIQLTRDHGKCVLVTTHDMHVAQELCDTIGIIKDGALVACQPTHELLTLFQDQTFEFRLDRLPDESALAGVSGVQHVDRRNGAADAALFVSYDPEPELRSAAIYATLERLREEGIQLHGINQHKQTLEDVFLRLTGDGSSPGTET